MTYGLLAAELETVWRLETHWAWPPWLTALLVVGAVSLVVMCYRWEATPARGAYRAALAGLRLTTLLLLLVMLSEAIYSGARTGRSRFAVLVDRSESMQRSDATTDDQRVTREAFARQAVLQDERLRQRLAEEYDVEYFWVDNGMARVIDPGEGPSSATNENESRAPVSGDAATTRLGDAIDTLLGAPSGAPLQGVLLLTDGQNTAGKSLSEAAESARRQGAPIYAVGIGSEVAPPEARLSDLLADETAFLDDLVKFEARLRTRGLRGATLRVELFEDGESAPLDTQRVVIDAADGEQTVRLLHRPTRAGEHGYRLVATVEEGDAEAVDTPRSELRHTLRVRDDKVRVLLAAGYPNYEYRYLKHLLERDKTLELSTLLQESDIEYAESDLTALVRFPIREEEFDDYDALVLIDLDPTLLPRSVWRSVARFVSEKGGGLAMVAGPRSLPTAYRGIDEFAALSPTETKTMLPGGWAEASGYRVLPTDIGARSPALQMADTPDQSDGVWRALPVMYWRAEVGRPKPAAQVLADHPGAGGAPLIVSQYYGAGRVVLHAFDGSWRWRRRVGDVFFARYWVQTIRELARGKHNAAIGGELATSQREYDLGDPVRLRLTSNRLPGDAAPVAIVESPGRPETRVELRPGAGGRGRWQATLSDLAPGQYRAVVAGEGDSAPIATDFTVVAPVGEATHPEMNRAALASAAERTRGAFLTADEIDRLADTLPAGRREAVENLPPIELWNRWPLLLAICLCLCAEWVLRKQRSML